MDKKIRLTLTWDVFKCISEMIDNDMRNRLTLTWDVFKLTRL